MVGSPKPLTMDKKELRREIRARLACLSAPERAARSAAVIARLTATDWWREAAVVLAFLPMPGELETWELVRAAREAGKAVAVPRIDGEELVFHRLDRPDAPLVSGIFGIPEPAASLPVFRPEEARLDPVLVVTPGLAFDGRFNRLGRGKGFYDRYLQRLRAADGRVRVVGVCFSEQLVAEVPVDGHDQPLDGLVTDREMRAPPSPRVQPNSPKK